MILILSVFPPDPTPLVWPEGHKMVIVRRVTGETPGKQKSLVSEAVHHDELHHHQGLPSSGAFLPCCAAAVAQDPIFVSGIIRRRQISIGSPWRKLNPGQQALLVLVYLRKGDTFAEVAAGFGVGTSTAWRYVNETVALLSARAPKLRKAIRDAKKNGHAYVVLDETLIPVDRSLGMPISSLGGGAPGSAFPGGPVWRLGQDRGDQECERVMGAGWPLGACTRPRPTSWTTAML